MDMKPILTFNNPNKDGKRGKLPRGGSKPRTPSLNEQASRILPKVQQLEKQFAEHMQLSISPEGMLPEKVLVLEVAGDVQNLAKSLSKVEGFNILSQNLIDSSFQNDFFYEEKNGKIKPVTKNAYLAMSNQTGLRKLHAMWKRFASTGQVDFGYAPLKDAFMQLSDIRFWDTKDRLESTFLLEDWQYRLEEVDLHGSEEIISFEIELWYRGTSYSRSQSESNLRKIIQSCGGSICRSFVHEGIGYHALLGSLPISKVQEVIQSNGSSLELMRCDEIMFFRPLGQCVIPPVDNHHDESTQTTGGFSQPPEEYRQPIVALFDGLPLENHQALKRRITVDDPDDFESLYDSPSEQVHGTSMASLILHGDLSEQHEPSLETPLYVRPILAPGRPQFDGKRVEQIPSEHLPIDLIHRAVVRMKDGENGYPPSAPEVVIINLSIGDPYRLFDTEMSPWARMLDWLSVKYNVLFVVSAGNMCHQISLEGVKEGEFNKLSSEQLEAIVIQGIARQKHERRMMSPAEAINVLTVKAAHSDNFTGSIPPNQIDVFKTTGMFSPINPISLGKKNSIKPELLMPGGRQTYINATLMSNEDVVLKPSSGSQFGPGLKTALPSSNLGALNTYGFTVGTSNAAALASRRLAFLCETIRSLKEVESGEALAFASDAVLLKALLAHGAEHFESVTDTISEQLKNKQNSRTFKSDLNQFLGFGVVDEKRIHACQKNQATLIYTGQIKDGKAHEYRLPLPLSLSAETVHRRLIVTVAWFSPVHHGHQDYRGAQLWATPAYKSINAEKGDYYHHHLKNGTVFHEIRTGKKAADFTQGDELAIQVHCNGRAGFDGIEVPYALVVTLDTPGHQLPIYEEVKQGLSIQVEQTV